MFSATSCFINFRDSSILCWRKSEASGLKLFCRAICAQPLACPLGSITRVRKRETKLNRWKRNVMIRKPVWLNGK